MTSGKGKGKGKKQNKKTKGGAWIIGTHAGRPLEECKKDKDAWRMLLYTYSSTPMWTHHHQHQHHHHGDEDEESASASASASNSASGSGSNWLALDETDDTEVAQPGLCFWESEAEALLAASQAITTSASEASRLAALAAEMRLVVGERVEGNSHGRGFWVDGTVDKVNSDGTYHIRYDDGEN